MSKQTLFPPPMQVYVDFGPDFIIQPNKDLLVKGAFSIAFPWARERKVERFGVSSSAKYTRTTAHVIPSDLDQVCRRYPGLVFSAFEDTTDWKIVGVFSHHVQRWLPLGQLYSTPFFTLIHQPVFSGPWDEESERLLDGTDRPILVSQDGGNHGLLS